ncbi:MAG: hypothetical protein EOP91_06080 [Lysobacteraceae bacterium]|nr:MAG: hypothetical protein EOP91_06080 [Xanthomonadaceae bacterium]
MTIHSFLPSLATVLALASLPLLASAQQSAQDLQNGAAAVDCAQLAAMPNAPITVEACEAQKAAFGNLGAAAAAPGGARPGDASMTCAQIIAELQASRFAGVSAQTAAEGVAAGEQLREAMASNQARAVGLAAAQTAGTAAASVAPNAVQGAGAMQHEAEQAALRRAAMAEIRPAQTRVGLANAASAQDLANSLQANPRAAALIQMAAARNCQMP